MSIRKTSGESLMGSTNIENNGSSKTSLDLERQTLITEGSTPTPEVQAPSVAKFLLCFVGLQCSYLTWGYMQELIMTTQFTPTTLSPSGLFPSATFCVFSNRFLAVALACALCKWKNGEVGVGVAGWLSFAPCSASNTISSWAQYGK